MRYQYSSRGFRQNFIRNPLFLPNGIKLLLIINIAVFILTEISGNKNIFFSLFGLVPQAVLQQYKIWQLFTYLFLHGGFFHIVLNMLFLWILGKDLEIDWGEKDFLIFYFNHLRFNYIFIFQIFLLFNWHRWYYWYFGFFVYWFWFFNGFIWF